ncbi:MAG TPA: hypothetical protein VGQ43_02385 [Candidatus Udaeobacter sp.]|jgi:hypothetical protein|nr:hypothetical protein [Candidatus Udaeobacter sp.]
MKSEFRRGLAQQPFEEKIHKVGELISLSRKVKADASDSEENTAFNGAELSQSVLGRDWNSPEEDAAWSNL